MPRGRETAIAGSLCLLSVLPPVQNFLLDKRTLVQAIYRDVTRQVPASPAPVTLVHIDELSLEKAGIDRPVPMDRTYLASLIDRLVTAEAQIIGIDYLLDRTQPANDPILARSVRDAVKDRQTWLVFAAVKQSGVEVGVAEETEIGSPNWTLQGYTTDSYPNYYLSLPAKDCIDLCPFSFLLNTIVQVFETKDRTTPQARSQPYRQSPQLDLQLCSRQFSR